MSRALRPGSSVQQRLPGALLPGDHRGDPGRQRRDAGASLASDRRSVACGGRAGVATSTGHAPVDPKAHEHRATLAGAQIRARPNKHTLAKGDAVGPTDDGEAAGEDVPQNDVTCGGLTRPIGPDGEAVYENLYAVGGLLAGAIRWREKSGEGIALASALAAADSILEDDS